MVKRKNRVITFILVIAICLSCTAFSFAAPASTNASSYLASYGAYCYAAGSGHVTVYFNVTGNGTQNYLGSYSIVIRQSADGGSTWTTVSNILYANHPNMMGTNCPYYDSSVTYYGTAGYKYYAIVYFWGGSSLSIGDSRSYATSVITAS